MNTTNTTPTLPVFTVAPTSMPGQSLLQWHETPGAAGLRSLQMPTHIAKAFAAMPSLVAVLREIHDDAAHALGTEAEPQERLSVARQDLETIREAARDALSGLV